MPKETFHNTNSCVHQALVWVADVPYLVTHRPRGFGLLDLLTFKRADDDYQGTLADVRRDLVVDPEDLTRNGGAMAYIKVVLTKIASSIENGGTLYHPRPDAERHKVAENSSAVSQAP